MTLSQTLAGGRKDTEKSRQSGQFRDGGRVGEAGGDRRRAGRGRGRPRGLEHPLSPVWGTKNFTGRQEPALLRAHSSGGSVRTKEADGIPREWIQRDGKNPDMLSHVHEFVKDCVCPRGPAPPPVLC